MKLKNEETLKGKSSYMVLEAEGQIAEGYLSWYKARKLRLYTENRNQI